MGTDAAGEAIECLRLARLIIDHEMNRPYEYWYGHQEPLVLDEVSQGRLLELLLVEAKVKGDEELNLRQAASAYLARETARKPKAAL